MSSTRLRRMAVAGQFYTDEPKILEKDAKGYIEESGVDPSPATVAAIIVPHAGYMYSGPTAGHSYARIKGKKPKRVILLGGSHRYRIDGASIFNRGAFETPLGDMKIDEAFADELIEIASKDLNTVPGPLEPHALEHSLEVQLPFIKVALGDVPIVPILFSSPVSDFHANFGTALAEKVDSDDIVVASTDLSHFLSEEEANEIDEESMNTILAKDWQALAKGIKKNECSMCGDVAVVAAMTYAIARGADKWTLLDYRTSSKASGDFGRVVGYTAISMEFSNEGA